jgi:aminocarboxymuconate-semialdehyde decarboxylase
MDRVDAQTGRVMISGRNFRTVADDCWSVERRLAVMAEDGVSRQAISPMPELLTYWAEPADARDFGRHLNEGIMGLVAQAPDRFSGLGMVPLQDPDLAAKELTDIKRMGLLGVELGSNILGKSLGEARFLPFFQEVERLGLAVFVHALHPTTTSRYPEHPMLVNAIGFGTDVGLTIGSIIASGLLDRFAGLRLAFSQGGGTFASLLPRWQYIWSGGGDRAPDAPPTALQRIMPRSPEDYARRLYYDTLQTNPRAIRYLIDTVGSSQLAVATDYPFVPRERPLGKTVREAVANDAEWAAISHENVMRFLGREERAHC